MKTTIAALAVILAAGSLLAGEKLEINGDFKKLNPKKDAPAGWLVNNRKNPDIGTAEIVPARDKDENALKVTTGIISTSLYTEKAYPVKPGATIKMKADVKGKGSADLLVYLYDETGFAAAGKVTGDQAVPDKFTRIKGSYTVKATYKVNRKDETVEAVPTSVRFALRVASGAEIVFEDVEAEIESAK